MLNCLLISVLLGTAQAEPKPPPEEPAVITLPVSGWPPNPKIEPVAAVAAGTPSDRWMLEKILQGTPLDDLCYTNRIAMYGWIDGSYTLSSAPETNLPMGFNRRANEFLVEQAWLRLTRSVITTGTEPTWGFLVDTFYGSDYRFTLSKGIFNSQLTAWHGVPSIYGVDPVQFYVEGYVPTVERGLDVKVGRFYTPFGLENADAPSNPLLSHSYVNLESPLDNSGVLFTLNLTPVWQAQAGIVLGSDIITDPADEPTFVGSIQYTQPPAGRSVSPNVVKFAVTLGSAWFNPRANFNHFDTFDLAWVHPLSRRLLYQVEVLYEFEYNVPHAVLVREGRRVVSANEERFVNFGGVAQYLIYTLTPRVSGTVRLELFDLGQEFTARSSPDGSTMLPGLYTDITVGLEFKLRPQPSGAGEFLIRPELRLDDNNESPAFSGHHKLTTAAVDFILRF